MAYLHCHSCDWSQDDFWTKTYNPLTKIWSDIEWLWKPRIMGMDIDIVDDLTRYTYVIVLRKKYRYGYKIFSWNWLILEIVKDIKLAFKQKWWTWKSWKKNKATAKCPECNKQNFDID